MKKLLLFHLFFSMHAINLSAQNVDTSLNMLMTNYPPEKVYVHYDKQGAYLAGETIWFKAYIYSNGKPGTISNNFYLQLYNAGGEIVISKQYPVAGSVVKGNIDIPDTLKQGHYLIRAFTPYMLNFEESFLYKKNVLITGKPNHGNADKKPEQLSLSFFPESGYLVDGILTVCGFKATDASGNPKEITGIIKTDDGTVIASFKSYHDGIGRIPFKPIAGKKYSAEVETAAGKRTYPLPEVLSSGINLKVLDEKGGKKFQLSRNEKGTTNFDVIKLVVDINNSIIYETEVAFEDYPSIVGHLITDSLPSGILHFTVFDKTGKPIAERLAFVDNKEYRYTGDIVATIKSFEKKAENNLEITFPDNAQRSCSVSIVDLGSDNNESLENIWSSLLLTSDIKGYVYNPAWYFTNKSDSVKLAIDNLMLTQGWSRYSWAKILANDFPALKYKDNYYLSFSGQLTDGNKTPVDGGNLNLLIEPADSVSQVYNITIDEHGRFTIDSVIFNGKSKIFYAYSDKKGRTRQVHLQLDENILASLQKIAIKYYSEFPDTETGINSQLADIRKKELERNADKVKELENVDVRSTINKKPIDAVNEKYTTGVFKSMGKETIDNINEPANDKAMNAVDFIKNRIQQLELSSGGFVNRKNMSLMSGQKWAVGIFINEQPATIMQLRVLRADDIALVKFYEAGFVGVGSGSPGGALAVYTKERKTENNPEKLDFFEFTGYSMTKEFFNPDYSSVDPEKAKPDYRTTLYWNPNVFTETGSSSFKFKFYNNDFSKKFRVIMEGFDAQGRLIHSEHIIE
ncbi:MAG: hypothetical protein IPM85_06190 [Chitinophagaceae bacterium]|nr:hypothetical protein [Chitinophagaceae bacterium]